MKLKGAEIIIKSLIEHGVDSVFGYPGGQVLDIYDELYKNRKKIRHITTSHEEGASHAADGYARATGKVGVVISTSGPGATNLVTGIATSFLDSTPLVAITGNVATGLMGKDSFQEVDITGITMPITKYNYIVKNVDELEETLNSAFELAISGRPGPVLIDVPKDVQRAKCEYKGGYKVVKRDYKKDRHDFAKVIELIEKSSRPCIYSGGGVISSGASYELNELAKRIGAPVVSSMMGLGAVDYKESYFLGMGGMHGTYAANKAVASSDLLLAIGTRFSDRATGDKSDYVRDKRLVHIDIDPAEINKNVECDYSIIGDIKCILSDIINAVPCKKNDEWNKEISSYVCDKRNDMTMYGDLTPETVIKEVRKRMGDSDIVTTDVGQHQMWVAQYYGFSKERTFLTSGGLGTMGFGLGAAIGATVATGRRTVLFTSDGSFHMNMNELATAVSEELPVIVIILNNSVLGMVKQWQHLFYNDRFSSTLIRRKTDYVMLAKAMGAEGARVTDSKELISALNKAFSMRTPYVIDCVIKEDELVLPMIPPGSNSDNILVRNK